MEKKTVKQRMYSKFMKGKTDRQIYNEGAGIFTSIKDISKARKTFNAELHELNKVKGSKVGRRKGVDYKPLPKGVKFVKPKKQ